jgi:hypothetical protein
MPEARNLRAFSRLDRPLLKRDSRDIRLIYRVLASQQYRHSTNDGASNKTGDLTCSRIP